MWTPAGSNITFDALCRAAACRCSLYGTLGGVRKVLDTPDLLLMADIRLTPLGCMKTRRTWWDKLAITYLSTGAGCPPSTVVNWNYIMVLMMTWHQDLNGNLKAWMVSTRFAMCGYKVLPPYTFQLNSIIYILFFSSHVNHQTSTIQAWKSHLSYILSFMETEWMNQCFGSKHWGEINFALEFQHGTWSLFSRKNVRLLRNRTDSNRFYYRFIIF